MHAASQLPGRGPSDVDKAPAPVLLFDLILYVTSAIFQL